MGKVLIKITTVTSQHASASPILQQSKVRDKVQWSTSWWSIYSKKKRQLLGSMCEFSLRFLHKVDKRQSTSKSAIATFRRFHSMVHPMLGYHVKCKSYKQQAAAPWQVHSWWSPTSTANRGEQEQSGDTWESAANADVLYCQENGRQVGINTIDNERVVRIFHLLALQTENESHHPKSQPHRSNLICDPIAIDWDVLTLMGVERMGIKHQRQEDSEC